MKTRMQKVVVWLFLLSIANVVSAQSSDQPDIDSWRAEREAKLKADDGWLTVAGLHWLKEGINTVGTSADNNFVLRAGTAPAQVGTFALRAGVITFQAAPQVHVTLNDQPIQQGEIQSDVNKKPDVLRHGDLTFTVIKRGDRFGIRLKDKNAPTRVSFSGLDWFSARADYRVTAQFIPHAQPKEIGIVNILGQVELMKSPGVLVFTLNGQQFQLDPISEGKQLFIIFRDLTSGKQTYPSGRFLYADLPVAGKVTLDFNKAYNPPCAFTAFATCPLPPRQNWLKVAIPAGEKKYHSHPASETVGYLNSTYQPQR